MAQKSVFARGFCLVLLLAIALLPWIPRQITRAATLAGLSDPGPYHAGLRDVTVTRGDGTTFTAALYYPAKTSGQDAVFDGSGGPYPAITYGHGAVSEVSYSADLLEHLATRGYFVIASKTYSGFVFEVDHAKFAQDMSDCLTYLVQQNNDSGSPYYHKVKVSAFGASGHSMGGGASILAAHNDARIKTVANLAPQADTIPPASTAIESLGIPVRLLAGSCDGITPVNDHQQVLYNHAHAPRQLAILQKATHNGFAPAPITLPETCTGGAMEQSTQSALTRAWVTGWFDYYLKGDSSLESLIWGAGLQADSRVVVQADAGSPTPTNTPRPTRTPRPPCEEDCQFFFPFGR